MLEEDGRKRKRYQNTQNIPGNLQSENLNAPAPPVVFNFERKLLVMGHGDVIT